jgi:FixJ family two-component response regulator
MVAESPEQPSLIVLVDDDPAVLVSTRFMLEVEGYMVLAHATGDALLASGVPAHATCLVIDYFMPDGNGLDLIERLRRDGVSTPAVLITGRLQAALTHRARAAQVPVVEKPLLGRALIEAIMAATA